MYNNYKFAVLLIFLFLLGLNLPSRAQNLTDSTSLTINPYISFRGNLAAYSKELELQDNVTRFGLKGAYKKGKISFIAGAELRLTLFQGGNSFNIDNNTSNEFLDITTEQKQQTISNRLGYLGLDFEEYGSITFGKQWSVYYDITSYTNQFYVFGARASATYPGNSDGGESGTGRANQAIIYRNQFGIFSFGAQAQVRGGDNEKFIDGYGFSGQLNPIKEIKLGLSVNKTFLSDELINSGKILGLDGQPTYYAVGVDYQATKLTASAVGVIEKNGDFAQGSYFSSNNVLEHPTVVFDAKGFECYANYNFGIFGVHAGYNLYLPKTKSLKTENGQLLINTHYKIEDFIFGVNYNPIYAIQIYAEQRLSYGRNSMDVKDQSVFALGMNVDISKLYKIK